MALPRIAIGFDTSLRSWYLSQMLTCVRLHTCSKATPCLTFRMSLG